MKTENTIQPHTKVYLTTTKKKITVVGENEEKLGPLYIVGGIVIKENHTEVP